MNRRDFFHAALAAPALLPATIAAGPFAGEGLFHFRHQLRREQLEQDFDFLLHACRRTGCRKLLLFTSSYEFEPAASRSPDIPPA
jgi:hypothetical protein